MSERLSAPEVVPANTAASATAATEPVKTRLERRQLRRAGVSLQVRVRTADFNDGNFEEVRTTLNASRKAIYFFTTAERYYKGMRVRVTSPYDPAGNSGNFEQTGEVVRVHRRDGGYGVAVALFTACSAAPMRAATQSAYAAPAEPEPIREISRAESERRGAKRSSFIAPVELLDMRTGSRIHARIADLSVGGCYVDTLNPLSVGAAVRLQVRRGDDVLDVLAVVSSRIAGSGMGLVFAEITPAQRAILKTWLGEAQFPSEMNFTAPRPAKNSRAEGAPQTACSVRLIQMLVRKGILNKSEATELLSEPNDEMSA
jgi:hypothetical protein